MSELSNLPRTQPREIVRRVRVPTPGSSANEGNGATTSTASSAPASRSDRGPQRRNQGNRRPGGRDAGRRPGKPRRQPRQNDEEEDDLDQSGMDGGMNAGFTLEDNFSEDFSGDVELAAYDELSEYIGHAESEWRAAASDQVRAQRMNNPMAMEQNQRWWGYVDDRLRHALVIARKAEDTSYPPHEPHSIDMKAVQHHRVGGIAAGTGGAGAVAEDALRLLAGREGHLWQDPWKLVNKVLAGEFVQFRSMVERRQVQTRLMNLPKDEKTGKKVRFAALPAPAYDAVLSGIIAGSNSDPAEADLQSDAEKQLARVIGGRWGASAKHTMLETIQQHLPKPKRVAKQ